MDFHWGEYTYSIAGESEIALSALLEKLGVTEIALADIAAVSFSDPTLVEVATVENEAGQTTDWLLRSLAPFNTDEALTLTLNNGKSVEIKVTDDLTLPASGTWDNGTDGSGRWTIDEDGVMTITGTGKIKDYTGATSTPWKDYRQSITKLIVGDGITHLGNNMLTRSYGLVEIDAKNCVSLIDLGTDLFKMNNYGGETGSSHLERVDFSGCTGLTTIGSKAFDSVGSITYLDISGTGLTKNYLSTSGAGFGASKGIIRTLKANNCTQFTETLDMSSGYSSLTTLELSGCTSLTSLKAPGSVTTLDVSGSGLTSVDLSRCTVLTSLDVSGCTGLSSLNLSKCTSLTSLDVSGSGLTSLKVPSGVITLNVSDCTSLTDLNISGCAGLTSLTVPGSVTKLNVSGSGLTSLTVPSGVTELDVSNCAGITSLDVSACTGLTKLNASGTGITSLDVSKCTGLTNLTVPNGLTSLNIAGTALSPANDTLKSSLETLYLSPTNAKNVNLSDYTALA